MSTERWDCQIEPFWQYFRLFLVCTYNFRWYRGLRFQLEHLTLKNLRSQNISFILIIIDFDQNNAYFSINLFNVKTCLSSLYLNLLNRLRTVDSLQYECFLNWDLNIIDGVSVCPSQKSLCGDYRPWGASPRLAPQLVPAVGRPTC